MRSLVLIIPLAFVLASCNQNMAPGTGETLANSPKPMAETGSKPPLAVTPAEDATGASGMSGDSGVPPFVKAYFMHNFVEALYSTPQNFNPNPKWESPLTDPVNGRVWCTDCHVSKDIDFAKIPKMRSPMVDSVEKDKVFMAGLMRKWVARLNSDDFGAKKKLKHPVNCLTCHETNPAP
jgi:hypothetical protein